MRKLSGLKLVIMNHLDETIPLLNISSIKQIWRWHRGSPLLKQDRQLFSHIEDNKRNLQKCVATNLGLIVIFQHVVINIQFEFISIKYFSTTNTLEGLPNKKQTICVHYSLNIQQYLKYVVP